MARLKLLYEDNPSWSEEKKDRVFNKGAGWCWYCGRVIQRVAHGKRSANGWQMDHRIPKSRCAEFGRSETRCHFSYNLVAACFRCNEQKNKKTEDEYFEFRADEGLWVRLDTFARAGYKITDPSAWTFRPLS